MCVRRPESDLRYSAEFGTTFMYHEKGKQTRMTNCVARRKALKLICHKLVSIECQERWFMSEALYYEGVQMRNSAINASQNK